MFAADPRAPVAFESYASHDHAGLEEMVRTFLASHPAHLDYACFGVAGPVRDGHVKTTNLAWPVYAASLARVLGLESVGLINDLAANAYGIAELAPDDLEELNPGVPAPDGAAVVVSAGTGLGEAGVLPDGDGVRVIPTEGGHTDFGPRSGLLGRLPVKVILNDRAALLGAARYARAAVGGITRAGDVPGRVLAAR